MAGSRGNYKSKHYDELLSWLSAVPGEHLTVQEIYSHFQEKGSSIGMATLYRLLDRMTEEGIVAKYTIDPATPACYEMIPKDPVKDEHISYHCKCEICGKLIHLHCDEIAALSGHLLAEHNFRLNPRKTVLVGICEDCLKAGKEL